MMYFQGNIVGATGTLWFSGAFSFLMTDFFLHYPWGMAYNLYIIGSLNRLQVTNRS